MHLLSYLGKRPVVAKSAFIARTATLIGDVEVGDEASIWYGAVLRGDVMPIRIGPRTSIQDNAVIHATEGWQATIVGADCTVGHGAILHGCAIGDRVLVGMGSIILDAAEIGEDVLIGAGSLITARTKIPPRVLVHGRPARVIRDLTETELQQLKESAELYRRYAREHLHAVEEP
ncbi:MAG: gamma carbonic anhydrase family protein [Sandaracinaceae bacterium]|nr:gamma carbonic anhydrase family protein [Sandaracinaceae bacterium]MDW8246933.1 gamma carbonic anhydrase family protein [Sandaracinaceae bacterium]